MSTGLRLTRNLSKLCVRVGSNELPTGSEDSISSWVKRSERGKELGRLRSIQGGSGTY